jgi:hypothetical protein
MVLQIPTGRSTFVRIGYARIFDEASLETLGNRRFSLALGASVLTIDAVICILHHP